MRNWKASALTENTKGTKYLEGLIGRKLIMVFPETLTIWHNLLKGLILFWKRIRNTSLAINTSFIFLKVPPIMTTQPPQSTLMPHNLTKTWEEISLVSSLSLSECNLFHSFLSHTYEAHIKDSCLILLYLKRKHCPCLLPFSSIAVLSISSISFCFHYFIYLSAPSFGIQLDTGL